MKILAIRGENLASLERFEVDLEGPPFFGAGVFAITGPTGAGKSTLLDAMCLALYDTTPRFGAGSRSVRVGGADHLDGVTNQDCRGILRRGAAAGFAEVDFRVADGRRYRARWEVRRARGRAAGRLQGQDMTLTCLDDDRVVSGGKKEVLRAIQEVIHLDFEQFRRSVLLAQGDFAAFLHANANDRASLLEAMTDTGIYSRVSVLAHERGRAAEDEVRALKGQIDQAPPLDDEARAAAEAQLATATQREAAAQRAVDVARTAWQWWERRGTLLADVAQAQQALASAEAEVEAAAPRRAAWVQVEAAQSARAVVEGFDAATGRVAKAREALQQAREAHAIAEASLYAAEAQLPALAGARQAAEARLVAAQPDLDAAAALDVRLADARSGLREAEAQARAVALAAASALAEAQAADRDLANLDRELVEAQAWLDARPEDAALATHLAVLQRALRAWDQAREATPPLTRAVGEADATRVQTERARVQAEATLAGMRGKLVEAEGALIAARGAVPEGRAGALRASRDVLQGAARALDACRQARQDHAAGRAREAEAQAATDAQRQRGAQAQARQAQLCVERPLLEARLAEARRSDAQLRAFASLEDRRASLTPGDPCPLCGATDHPYAEGLSPVIHEQAARVDALAQERDALQREEARLDETLRAADREAKASALRVEQALAAVLAAEQRWVDHQREAGLPETRLDDEAVDVALEQVAKAQQAASERIAGDERALDAAERARAQAEAACDNARAEVGRAAETHRVAEAAAERAVSHHAQQVARLAAAEARLAETWAELCEVLPSTVSRDALVAEPRVAGAALVERAAAWLRREAERESSMSRRPALQEALSVAGARSEAQAQEAKKLRDAQRQRSEALAELVASREVLLGGRSVEAARAEHGAAIAGATEQHHAAVELSEQRRRAETAARSTLDGHRAQLKASIDEEATAGARLDAACARLGADLTTLRSWLVRGQGWVSQERDALDALRRALEGAQVRCSERERALAAHDAAPPTAQVEAHLAAAAVAEAEGSAREARKVAEDARLVIREDDLRRRATAALRDRIAATEAASRPWRVLRDLIGSADGRKFRTFAQSLALDALLQQANHHLRELNPRYRLQRIPGLDLDLQVLDAEHADEPRAINSLSGGETFLASLALALGLSSLAAERTPVGSLFIDEGFGTLDPATLDIALDTLHGLQRQGRQVGLISHVPGIGEKLGVELAVVRRGGGRSEVVVR